tara:strand:+ start:914 stop:1339 length:426 start_codon:yes stop_codon:yes gene_type:complete
MLASLLPELLPIVGSVLDRFFPDKEANARAKRELEMQFASHLAKADLAQAQTNIEQAKHPSIFVSGARPAIMWICAFGLGWQFVLQPVAIWAMAISGSTTPLPIIPTEGLMSLTLALLGLGGMRSAEKFKGVARNNIKTSK